MAALELADVVDLDDVRVMQAGGGLGLLAESGLHLRSVPLAPVQTILQRLAAEPIWYAS